MTRSKSLHDVKQELVAETCTEIIFLIECHKATKASIQYLVQRLADRIIEADQRYLIDDGR